MDRLLEWIRPPRFADAAKTHRAFLIHVVTWSLIVASLPYLVADIVFQPTVLGRDLLRSLAAEFACVLVLVLTRRGQLRAATTTLIGSMWLYLTIIAVVGSGTRGQAYQMGFPVVILIAGGLGGVRAALMATAGCLATGAAMAWLDWTGRAAFLPQASAGFVWLVSLMLFPLLAVLQYLAGRALREALSTAGAAADRYRLLVEESPEGILVVDRAARITLANAAALRAFRCDAAALVGREWSLLLDRPDSGSWLEAPGEQDAGCSPWREGELRRPDGSRVPVMAWAKQMADGQREIVFQDITERRRADQERHRLEQQLDQVQRMESIGRLAGGIAHDFNNLLTIISGNIQLLGSELPPDPAARASLSELTRATDSASTLTRQLLAFGRKQPAERRPVDVNRLVADVERMLRRLLGEEIALVTTLTPGLPPVSVDPGQIEQVLLNLSANARDAMSGGGRLTIETARGRGDQTRSHRLIGTLPAESVVLTVSDTGAGMSEEVLQHLFEPFYTTKGRGKGTGLGLSTVYGIVHQNEAALDVESTPGAGSAFRLILPIASADAPLAEAASTPAEIKPGTETVLLVEDEEQVRVLAVKMLVRCGYTVLARSSAEETMKTAVEDLPRVDILVTDVVMPGMNGRQLAQALRAIKPGLPVLYTSGYTADVIARHGVLLEGLDFLPKPFTPQMLTTRLRAVLDGPARQDRTGPP